MGIYGLTYSLYHPGGESDGEIVSVPLSLQLMALDNGVFCHRYSLMYI